MEWLLRMYRSSSSPVAIALLIIVNLIPLAGALFWGWDVFTLLILYWLENGIVGVFTVLKMALAQGPLDTRSGAPETVTANSRVTLIPFFIVHYGLFWVVHGVFVLSLPAFIGIGGLAAGTPPISPDGNFIGFEEEVAAPRLELVAWGAIALVISHGASFLLNYIGRGEYRRARLGLLMFSPYPRLFALHLTILVGGILSISLGSPIGSMIVLVAIKIAIDLALHIREHRRAGAGTVAAPPATA